MDDKTEVYWEIFKRNLDTRRQLIFATLAAVLAFGAWAIQSGISAEKHSGPWRIVLILFIAAAVTWPLYFYMLFKIDQIIDETWNKIAAALEFSQAESDFVRERLNKKTIFVPFGVSLVLNCTIIILAFSWPG